MVLNKLGISRSNLRVIQQVPLQRMIKIQCNYWVNIRCKSTSIAQNVNEISIFAGYMQDILGWLEIKIGKLEITY